MQVTSAYASIGSVKFFQHLPNENHLATYVRFPADSSRCS